MGTFIGRDSWLNRRNAAGLFGWGTTETGPVVTPTETSSSYDRHYFVGFPEGWVVKKRNDSCGNDYGKLRLEVTTTTKKGYANFQQLSSGPYSSDLINANDVSVFSGPFFYDPQMFSGGNGHVYENFEVYSNIITPDPADAYYYHFIATLNDYTQSTGSGFEDGGLEPYNGNTADYEWYFGNWSNKMTPQDVIDWSENAGEIPTVDSTHLYVRKTGDSPWDRKSDVSTYVIASTGINDCEGIANYSSVYQRGMTFRWDEDWPASGTPQNTTCKFRWKYDPQSTEGCKWWAGKVLSLKVTYKKAAVTRVPGPDGVFLTIGTWESGGNSTQSATLQDSYSEAYIADEVTMPIEDGYVYVIDDLEVVSVT